MDTKLQEAALQLEKEYQSACAPFTRVWIYEKRCVVFEGFSYNDTQLKIDVWVNQSGYEVHFWASNNDSFDMGSVFKPLFPQLEGFALNNGHINNLKKEFQDKATFLLFLQPFLLALQKLDR
jgi:hypothetical protein